ncbi:type II secretion system major pseudopilin GspG [Beijerinckia mobilis]|uniref:type II secretion system major pseudopilin GspG n=1 Tax=Beijerinckia mobilis TaxID=231434 RepID=UPI000A73882B|nr:type II secretion system major pseudopilin GspG [Beijerinckia mobilis]
MTIKGFSQLPLFRNVLTTRRTLSKLELRRKSRHSEAGFTLVEMLVVLAIIGLLVGLVAPRVLGQLSEAKVKTAHIQIESFKNALDLYFIDAGRYPTTNEGLTALAVQPPGVTSWNGPYLKGTGVPRDPWNHAYLYRSPGANGRPYDIVSLGPSGHEGSTEPGNGAVTSW